jgi:AraC-like DNA-binding protein
MVCFAHPGPANVKRHEALLACPVEFNHSFDGLVLTKRDLVLPIARATPQLRVHAERYVRSLAATSHDDFATAVSTLITTLLPLGRCNAGAVARHLGIDRSTLARRLQTEGLSFSQLLQRERSTLATRACLSGRPLAAIADELGFAAPSTFSRWFAQSFGCSATAWRQQHAHASQAVSGSPISRGTATAAPIPSCAETRHPPTDC